MTETRSTCPYCGVGCGVLIRSEDGRITGVRGDPEHPANFGRLCTKGQALHLTAAPEVLRQARLLHPMQREQRHAAPRRIGWDAALDLAAGRLAAIARAHGPEAIGFYISGQLLTEDYYVFNKLAKGLLGSNNIDSNSRLCMSSAVTAYKQTLGADAPPACYEDVEQADCIFIAGSNTAWAHPVLFRRIEAARAARPQLKIVCVDPRRTDTAEAADLHLQLQPGTDTLLYHGLLHILLWEGWTRPDWIAAHTSGFEALRELVRECTPQAVAQTCGLQVQDLYTAARWFAQSPATLSLWCQGLNQSANGTARNAALINLHLATGQIGRPGAGPFSLTGQPNAMGGREVGGMATLLSAHRDLANPQHRAEVAALWGVPAVPERPGKTAVEMFQAAADGEIKALWIACTNPAQSLPDQSTVRRALQRAEFVLVQEAFAHTETARYADLLLPASTWGEKEGTVTNSERRISRVRAAVPPPGEARADWQIVVAVARRLEAAGCGQARAGGGLFPYQTPEQIWNEHRASTRGRDLDITGLTYAMLEQAPQQWPFPQGARRGQARLYQDGRFATPDGRARFAAVAWQPVAEPRDARYPFALTTVRLRDQWHGMSRTGNLGRLFGHVPEPVVQLHPLDLQRRQLKDGDLVHVTSRRGSLLLPLQASDTVAPGQACIPMHWGPEFLGGQGGGGERGLGVNALTQPAFCPQSRQPELKHAAVKVLPADLPWRLFAAAWLEPEAALAARNRLRELLGAFPFASCVPFSNGAPLGAAERTGLLFRAAAYETPPEQLLEPLLAALGLDGPETLRYADARRGRRRLVRLRADGGELRLQAVLLAGDASAEGWLKALLLQELPAQAYGRLLLAPGATPPVALQARGRQVCNCLGVAAATIEAELASSCGSPDERLATVQAKLGCGTQCGSCLPELRRMARATTACLSS